MIKLLKYEFLRSYKVILATCSIIILFNISLFFKSQLPVLEKLVFFLPVIILLTLTTIVVYEIGTFKKDFIDNFPSIVQSIPKSAHLFFGAKVLKSFLCVLLYYVIMIFFSIINSKDYVNSILLFYDSYQNLPMMIVGWATMVLLILDLILVGVLSLLAASRLSYDRKKIFILAFISGLIIFLFLVFLMISAELPFSYSLSLYQCEILSILLAVLFISACILLENKLFLSFRSIRQLIITVVCIILLCSAGQYVTYTQRIVENTDYAFADDPDAKGTWKTLGRTDDITCFDPNEAEELENYPDLESINITDNGNSDINYIKWTKNALINKEYSTVSKYDIKSIYGDKYMFIEWKDKFYVYEHAKPFYLILRQNKE